MAKPTLLLVILDWILIMRMLPRWGCSLKVLPVGGFLLLLPKGHMPAPAAWWPATLLLPAPAAAD